MDLAETTRGIEVAKRAMGRFEPAFAGYGGAYADLPERSGFAFSLLQPEYTAEKIDHLWRVDRMETFAAPFSEDEVERRVRSELEFYEHTGAQAVFIGFTLTAYLSARIAKLPLVALAPFSFTRPFLEAGLGTWPDQFRPAILRAVPDAWLDRALTRWASRTRAWLGPLNAVAKRHGLQAWGSLVEFWEADDMLVADVPEVTGVPRLPDRWRYVGPVFAHLDVPLPQALRDLPHDKPRIYCAMGSSAEKSVAATVLEGLGQVDAHVFAPLRPILGEDFDYPDNVLALDWLPAPEANALADIAVIHGGQGTVQTAIGAGTPFVGVGLQPEQEWNIDAVVRAGSAVRLSRRGLTPELVAEAVRRLLDDEDARSRAVGLQRVYRATDGARATADFLGHIVGGTDS